MLDVMTLSTQHLHPHLTWCPQHHNSTWGHLHPHSFWCPWCLYFQRIRTQKPDMRHLPLTPLGVYATITQHKGTCVLIFLNAYNSYINIIKLEGNNILTPLGITWYPGYINTREYTPSHDVTWHPQHKGTYTLISDHLVSPHTHNMTWGDLYS